MSKDKIKLSALKSNPNNPRIIRDERFEKLKTNFSKYHYLSDKLPGGKIYLYGLFHNENQIGFQCFANYTPVKKGYAPIYHSNRTVIHPDYNGLGLGIKLINETSKLLNEKIYCKIMAKFSSMPVFKAMIKQTEWKFLGETRLMGNMKRGNMGHSKGGFRDKGVKTYNFVYVGNKQLKNS